MPLIYAFAAREDGTILAEYSALHGNFREVATECLPHLRPDAGRLTITCDAHTFNYARKDSFIFLVVADEAFGRVVPFAFLARLSDDFINRFGSKARTAPPLSLNRAAAPLIKQHMEYCCNNPDEISRIAGVQCKVDEVKGVMVENIEKVLERGERIQVLVDKTDELRAHAARFQKQGRALRSNMWWANVRMKVIIVAVVLLLAVVIFLLACFAGGKNCIKRNQA